MNIKFYFTLLISLFCFNLIGQYSTHEIDSIFEDAINQFNVAGAAVAIVKDNKIVHAKGYGVESIDNKKKANEHTLFAIASNSKAFTSAALAQLVDEGKIGWQDNVKQYIPEFKMYNSFVAENFTIQDLLTHRSGLGLGIGDLMWFPDGHDFTMDDILAGFEHFEPIANYRINYAYNNLLYLIAGEVIKRVSGLTWEEYIQKNILTPLNMNETYPSISWIKNKANLALPHTTNTGKLRSIDSYDVMVNGAAAGLYASVSDLSKWMLAHLNKGKYGDSLKKQLFSTSAQHEMWKIHTTHNAGWNNRYNSHFAGYGLAWNLTDKKGNIEVSHTGGMPGMLSRTVMIPDLNLGIVILTNTEPGGAGVFGAVSRTLVDSYLGLDDYSWVKKYKDYFDGSDHHADSIVADVWKTVNANSKKKAPKKSFLGTYNDKWFGDMEVHIKNSKLWVSSKRSPKLNGELQFYKANTFAVKWEYQDMNADAFVLFSLDENGKAQGMKLKGISPNIDFSFDFEDLDLIRVKE